MHRIIVMWVGILVGNVCGCKQRYDETTFQNYARRLHNPSTFLVPTPDSNQPRLVTMPAIRKKPHRNKPSHATITSNFRRFYDENDHLFYSGKRCVVSYNAKNTPALDRATIDAREYMSNFYPCKHGVEMTHPFTGELVVATTSEHWFQAMRFARHEPDEQQDVLRLRKRVVDAILVAPSPSKAYFIQRWALIRKKDKKLSNAAPFPSFAPIRAWINKLYEKGLRRFPEDRSADLRIMQQCVQNKFDRNPELMEKLLSTGDTRLVEHTARDSRWGSGPNNTGTNWLGLCLMKVRDDARRRDGDAFV